MGPLCVEQVPVEDEELSFCYSMSELPLCI